MWPESHLQDHLDSNLREHIDISSTWLPLELKARFLFHINRKEIIALTVREYPVQHTRNKQGVLIPIEILNYSYRYRSGIDSTHRREATRWGYWTGVLSELRKELLLIGKMRIASTLLQRLHVLRTVTIHAVQLHKRVYFLYSQTTMMEYEVSDTSRRKRGEIWWFQGVGSELEYEWG